MLEQQNFGAYFTLPLTQSVSQCQSHSIRLTQSVSHCQSVTISPTQLISRHQSHGVCLTLSVSHYQSRTGCPKLAGTEIFFFTEYKQVFFFFQLCSISLSIICYYNVAYYSIKQKHILFYLPSIAYWPNSTSESITHNTSIDISGEHAPYMIK